MGCAAQVVAGRSQVGPHLEDGPGIDARGRQQHVGDRGHRLARLDGQGGVGRRPTEGATQERLVGTLEVDLPLAHEGAHQGEAVGVEARRGQAKQDVPGPGRGAVEQVRPLHDADAATGQVEFVDLHEPRMLGRLAADQGAADGRAGVGHRAHDGRHGLRHEASHREVVKEGQRLRPAAHDVVGAHADHVGTDAIEAAGGRGEHGLRADAVGGGHQKGLPIALRDGDRPGEAAEAPDQLRPSRPLDGGTHQLDRPLTRRHVHAGPRVGRPRRGALGHRTPARCSSWGSSRMNLWLATSYGTGTGYRPSKQAKQKRSRGRSSASRTPPIDRYASESAPT